ncbi:unnamed protein product, partial [Adineta steineri]
SCIEVNDSKLRKEKSTVSHMIFSAQFEANVKFNK